VWLKLAPYGTAQVVARILDRLTLSSRSVRRPARREGATLVDRDVQTATRRTILLYALVCLPAFLLLGICLRGAYSEVRLVRTAVLSTETSRLRSQATRRASQLETVLEFHPGSLDWESLRGDPSLQNYWEKVSRLDENHLYASLVDRSGKIVMHTDSSLVGTELGRRWYDYAIPEAGSDIVHLSRSALARQQPAFDIRIPLSVRGRPLADYHQGIDAEWFEGEVASMQSDVLEQWTWVIVLAVAVDAAALAALGWLAKSHIRLQQWVRRSGRERAAHLSQIGSGLAHEIRNPLHSLRINLYTLKRVLTSGREPDPDDLNASLQESNNAIDDLERLMRDLLRFTDSDGGQRTEVNLAGELQATVNLMQGEMQQKQIRLRVDCPNDPVPVEIDPSRLRQLLQNLLTFAQNNSGASGEVKVALKRLGNQAEIRIRDSGPKLSDNDRSRLFEPFEARQQTGTGLGLALVKAFAEEAGGDVVCNGQVSSGNEFRLKLPILSTSR
jgi:signal transduction histidine kinase